MTPEEFAKLPASVRYLLNTRTAPEQFYPETTRTTDPATKAGVMGLLGEVYDPNLPKHTRAATYAEASNNKNSNRSFITYNPYYTDKELEITKAHEIEHALANQGLGNANKINELWEQLINGEGAEKADIVHRLVKHAPYLQAKWGLRPQDAKAGYFSDRVLLQPDMEDYLSEQFATLSALEQLAKKRFVEDPYIRKNILRTPAEREAYEALTNLRQTRMDAKDLPPYTRIEGSTSTKADPDGLWDRIKKAFGYANGGSIDKALQGGSKMI